MGNIILLLASIIIYASFGLSNLIFIGFSLLTTFLSAKYMNPKNKKVLLITTITSNVLILVFFKLIMYNSFFNLFSNTSILVPLGISYYTFQVLGYLIDVYRGKYSAEQSLYKYTLFVLYIPYLFMGPINRYDKIKNTLYEKRKITKDNLSNGIIRILWGLFKKLVIASRIGIIIASITSESLTGSYVLFALVLYSIQLYSDFSGGIDIVLGISKIIGINMPENFNSPYFASNLKEFWRLWHITLSSWLRDYIYIPLGGNRCSKIRNKFNTIVTFVISGLWHGLNYFLWGLIHGVIVAFTPKENKHKILGCILTFLIVSLLWSFFVYPTSIESLKMVSTIFYQFNYLELFKNFTNLGLDFMNYLVLILSIISLALFDYHQDKITKKITNSKIEHKLIIMGTISLIILVFGVYGLGFNASEFIYSKF